MSNQNIAWQNPDGTLGASSSSAGKQTIPSGSMEVSLTAITEREEEFKRLVEAAAPDLEKLQDLAAMQRQAAYEELRALGLSVDAAAQLTGHSGPLFEGRGEGSKSSLFSK